MLCWLGFLVFGFWASLFSLLLSSQNFFSMLLGAEAVWAVLYALASAASLVCDDLNLFSLTFFILGFAAAELALGVMLLVLLRFSGLSLDLGSRAPQGLNG